VSWPVTLLGLFWIITTFIATAPLTLTVIAGTGLPAVYRWAAVMIVALAAWRPLDAVMVAAGFAPIGILAAVVTGGRGSATEWLIPAMLIGLAAGSIRRPTSIVKPPCALMAAALLLAWFALASMVVQAAAQRPYFETSAEWRHTLLNVVGEQYYGDHASFRFIASGLLLAQGILIVPIVAGIVTTAIDTRRVAAMLLLGAGAAATQNVVRLLTVAISTGEPLRALWRLAGTLRISSAFADVNAAGSYFALASIVACGIALDCWYRRSRSPFALAILALVLTTSALWLAGSRVAIGAIPIAVLLLVVLRLQETGRLTLRRLSVLLVCAAVAIVVAWAATESRRPRKDASDAYIIRKEFVRTTWNMLRDHPVFGVGVGRYFDASQHYSSERLKRYYSRQNAHNNFLQIAGELGPLALAAFIVVLGETLRRLIVYQRASSDYWLALGLLGGIFAFLLTCFGGHPLLIPEVSASFFLTLGVAASLSFPRAVATGRSERNSARWAIAMAVAAFLLTVTVPLRVNAALAGLDLDHVLLGELKWNWQEGEQHVDFRGRASLYVPARGQRAVVSLRSPSAPREPVEVTLSVNGKPLDVVHLMSGAWHSTTIAIPRLPQERFGLLQLNARWTDSRRQTPPKIQLRRVRDIP
jgi:O-antigen ligase